MALRPEANPNKVLVGLKRVVVATFNSGSWKELGCLVGRPEAIEEHPRLLRSLSFGDDDYDSCAFAVLRTLAGENFENIDAIEKFVELEPWLLENDPAFHQELYGGTPEDGLSVFSIRHGYAASESDSEITIREEAPTGVRTTIIEISAKATGDYDDLLWLAARLGKKSWQPPDATTGAQPRLQLLEKVFQCSWYRVYDFVEMVYEHLSSSRNPSAAETAEEFQSNINSYFRSAGVGWQLVEGQLVARGPEAFEAAVSSAKQTLRQRPTTRTHLHESLLALSRRPTPNLSGAVYHAMGALECLSRDMTGDSKATLGEILKRHPELVPKPLDSALSQIWGFASNEARHVLEGKEPSREETELIVGLAASVVSYLDKKSNSQ